MSDWDDDEAFNFAMSMQAEEDDRRDEENERAIAEHIHDTERDRDGG